MTAICFYFYFGFDAKIDIIFASLLDYSNAFDLETSIHPFDCVGFILSIFHAFADRLNSSDCK